MKSVLWHRWRNPLRVYDGEERVTAGEQETRDSFDEGRPPHFIGPISIGSLGYFPVWEGTQADDLFDFWVGHTSERVSPQHELEIEGVPGVEELSVLTPYRFRVAVARHRKFKADDVKAAIEELFRAD
jgi:hypothetical protein